MESENFDETSDLRTHPEFVVETNSCAHAISNRYFIDLLDLPVLPVPCEWHRRLLGIDWLASGRHGVPTKVNVNCAAGTEHLNGH
jgi:hypothetical protein